MVVFVVAMPILVLFTSGYQIDWHTRKIVKTGAVVAKTLPSKAILSIDGKQASGTTPETVRFLLPKDYDISLSRDGYQTWSKRLSVNAQFATWANYNRDFVTLFYTNPEGINNQTANFTSLSSDNSEIAYVQNNQLGIYDVSTQTNENLGDISNLDVPFTFTGSLQWTNAAAAFQLFRNHQANFNLDPRAIQSVQTDGQNLALISQGLLYVILNNQPTLVDKQVGSYNLDGENLWYVQNSAFLDYNLRTGEKTTVYQNLPASSASQIIRGEGHTFVILDKTLYTINDTLEKIYAGVSFANYDTSAHQLLFADGYEILTYDPQQKTTDLILRSISPVTNPIMNFYTGYIFFANEGKIKAIELDGRDHRNIYTILSPTVGNFGFTLTSDGSVLVVYNDSTIQSFRIR